LKIQTLRPAPAKSPAHAARPAFARGAGAFAPVATPPKPAAKPGAPGRREGIAGEERRRSQRVLLRVRANIHVALQGKPVTFEATTLSVNSHGALVVLEKSLPIESRLVLEHCGTKEKVACRVTRTAREMPEGYHVPLEFDSPAPNFWRIAFPPADWRPPDDV
jgi:hypothetical protein